MLIHVFLTNRHRTHWEEKNLAPNGERGGDSLRKLQRNGKRGERKRGGKRGGKEKDNSQSGHSLMKEIVG